MGDKHGADKSRVYHDRIAATYDAMYDEPFWDFHDQITWNHLKKFIPTELESPVLDLGCGTGKWGFKLLKAGHPTTFVDHSPGMIEMVRGKLERWKLAPDLEQKTLRAALSVNDAKTLEGMVHEQFGLALGMGDVVSICGQPAACLSAVHRVLKPGGVFVFTVDNLLAAMDHFCKGGNLDLLEDFIRTGNTHWLTSDEREQFAVKMFTPAQIEHLVTKSGFEVISQIGKTVLPVRQNRKFFLKSGSIKQMIDLEGYLGRDPSAAARASHLQLAVRKR